MRKMRGIATIAAVFTCGAVMAAAITKDEYKAARQRIVAEYGADRQKCGARYGNAADLCIARAHGEENVARAELEAAYKPGPLTNFEAAVARAKAAHAIAKEECDDKERDMRRRCVAQAAAALEDAKAEAESVMGEATR